MKFAVSTITRLNVLLFVVVAILSLPKCEAAESQPQGVDRLRVIIETDAGGDPDDEQSLVRFLLYVNEWDIEGIIATQSKAKDGENLNKERTGFGIVRQLINAYGACYPSLVKHDPRYPTAEQLLKQTVTSYEGDAGVDFLMRAVDRDDPRPVWFLNWGTDIDKVESVLKTALDRVQQERGPEGYAKFKQKLRLSSSDKFGDHTFKIEPPFPIWVDTFRPEVDRKRWYHRFSGITAKAGGFDVKRDLLKDHGPLGPLYPLNTTHPQKEGDTMTFLYLVPTGMNDPNQPSWGSWAGRYGPQKPDSNFPYYWADVPDEWNGTKHRDNTLIRFAADLQNDFRARLDWCVKPVSEANHAPVVRIEGDRERMVRSGEMLTLDASASSDPDGNKLNYRWWNYPEAGTYRGKLAVDQRGEPVIRFIAPEVDSPATIHVVLTVTDSGSPPLARYARTIITVNP